MIAEVRQRLRPLRRGWRSVVTTRKRAPDIARRRSKPFVVGGLRRVNQGLRATAGWTHGLQTRVEWGWQPAPEWFDHHLGTHYAAEVQSQTISEERGVYATLAVPLGGHVLDLCCGDGWYAKHFYARRAATVTAVDYDASAIAYARRVNHHPAVTHEVRDVRNELPDGPFDGVVWSGAIEHFSEAETQTILRALHSRMTDAALLAGDTILAAREGVHLVHHQREYGSEEELIDALTRVFAYACAWRSEHRGRTELYFFASDTAAKLPFLSGQVVSNLGASQLAATRTASRTAATSPSSSSA